MPTPNTLALTCPCGAALTFTGSKKAVAKQLDEWREDHRYHTAPNYSPVVIQPNPYPEPRYWWQNPIVTHTTTTDVPLTTTNTIRTVCRAAIEDAARFQASLATASN